MKTIPNIDPNFNKPFRRDEALEQANAEATQAHIESLQRNRPAPIEPGKTPLNIGELWLPAADGIKALNVAKEALSDIQKRKAEDQEELEQVSARTNLDDDAAIAELARASTRVSLYPRYIKNEEGKVAKAVEGLKATIGSMRVPLIGEIRRKQKELADKISGVLTPHMTRMSPNGKHEYTLNNEIERIITRTGTYLELRCLEASIKEGLDRCDGADAEELQDNVKRLWLTVERIANVTI